MFLTGYVLFMYMYLSLGRVVAENVEVLISALRNTFEKV